MRWNKLNADFDAEPNAPRPVGSVDGPDVVVEFLLNPFGREEVAGRDMRGADNDRTIQRPLGQSLTSTPAPAP